MKHGVRYLYNTRRRIIIYINLHLLTLHTIVQNIMNYLEFDIFRYSAINFYFNIILLFFFKQRIFYSTRKIILSCLEDVYCFRMYNEQNLTHKRFKRGVIHLYNMVVCATGCNPLAYKGYGCYCGFLGSGYVIDEIDR